MASLLISVFPLYAVISYINIQKWLIHSIQWDQVARILAIGSGGIFARNREAQKKMCVRIKNIHPSSCVHLCSCVIKNNLCMPSPPLPPLMGR